MRRHCWRLASPPLPRTMPPDANRPISQPFPGWDGVWLAEGQETDISGRDAPRRTRFFGLDAPWNDVGWARMRSAVSILTSASFAQSGFGFPAMMDNFSELSFFVGLRQTVILNAYRETRIIHTDGRDHIPDDEAFPSTWGDSIGCWEGDTLTIDTVNVHFDPVFNPVTAPLSDQAHFSERLRLVAPGRIEMRMTITDPQLLTEPWDRGNRLRSLRDGRSPAGGRHDQRSQRGGWRFADHSGGGKRRIRAAAGCFVRAVEFGTDGSAHGPLSFRGSGRRRRTGGRAQGCTPVHQAFPMDAISSCPSSPIPRFG